MKVGLGPGHIVLDWDPALPPTLQKGTPLPIFSLWLWSNSLMGQDATWYDGRPRPGNIVLDADPALPSPPPPRGTAPSKRLDGSRCHFIRR